MRAAFVPTSLPPTRETERTSTRVPPPSGSSRTTTSSLNPNQLVVAVGKARLPTRGARLRAVAAASSGGLAAWLAMSFGMQEGGRVGAMLAFGCLVMGGLCYWLVVQRLPNFAVLYLAALLAGVVGAII